MAFIVGLAVVAPFSILVLFVGLEATVLEELFFRLDVQAFFAAVFQASIEDLILAELAFQRAVEQGEFGRWTESDAVK